MPLITFTLANMIDDANLFRIFLGFLFTTSIPKFFQAFKLSAMMDGTCTFFEQQKKDNLMSNQIQAKQTFF